MFTQRMAELRTEKGLGDCVVRTQWLLYLVVKVLKGTGMVPGVFICAEYDGNNMKTLKYRYNYANWRINNYF